MGATIRFDSSGMYLDLENTPTTEEVCALQAIHTLLVLPCQKRIPPRVLPLIPDGLWATGPDDIGLLPVTPVRIFLKEGALPPHLPQYPLKAGQEQALEGQISAFLRNGVLIPCMSPANTPLFPVKKRTAQGEPEKYRLVQDLRAVNAATILETPVVPNPNTLLSQIPPFAACFTVIDLTNAFFSVPLEESSRYLFAFTYRGKQYTWTGMPQGAQNSPNQFTQALQTCLQPWILAHPDVVLLQYVDDLLLCAPTAFVCEDHSISLLQHLASINCKVSQSKLQWCSEKVVFLGHCISSGTKHLTEDRKKAVAEIKPPQTLTQLQAFLGMITYCRQWIPNASALMQPLYDSFADIKDSHGLPIEAMNCFYELKNLILQAPALGIPDYTQPFFLFISENNGHASGVLAQKHGGRTRPLGYYSCRLDPVARAAPTCLRVVLAAQALLDKTADLILGHPVTILAPHNLQAILKLSQQPHLSMQRKTRLQSSLLLPENVTLQRCTILNPATLLPLSRGECDPIEGNSAASHRDEDYPAEEDYYPEHDCVQQMEDETSRLSNVSTSPLDNPDYILFTDGSRYADERGQFHTGFAVVTLSETVMANSLPSHMSAQEAELRALTEACKLVEGKTANIYTDSAYAHGIAHDFGLKWALRGFQTASGTPIKNHRAVKTLMEALHLPAQVAILKVKAHGRTETEEAKGNYRADLAAKAAALLPEVREEAEVAIHVLTRAGKKKEDEAGEEEDIPNPGITLLKQFQSQIGPEEKKEWEKQGAKMQEDGFWRKDKRLCLPRALFPAVVQWAHGVTHRGKNQMISTITKFYLAPGISITAATYAKSCDICKTCNPGGTVHTPKKHLAKPLYPFQRIQIDHMELPKSGRYKYVLVVVDMFSGWTEAYPVVKMTAKLTVKRLLTDLVCRFGVPEVIESDQGLYCRCD
ncbi:uncharacterized protein [Dendropsophus ebraccatus]|uniref:uncharacterized protein n=1 Tax=Dendropsophus ebraccatus TaxID=150705 RepID=UPI0038317956